MEKFNTKNQILTLPEMMVAMLQAFKVLCKTVESSVQNDELDSEIAMRLKLTENHNTTFKSKTAHARTFLRFERLINSISLGYWKITEKGMKTNIDISGARNIISKYRNEKAVIRNFIIDCILDGLDDANIFNAIEKKFGNAKTRNVKWYRSKVWAVLNITNPTIQTTREIYEVYKDNRKLDDDEVIDRIQQLNINFGSYQNLKRTIGAFRNIEDRIATREYKDEKITKSSIVNTLDTIIGQDIKTTNLRNLPIEQNMISIIENRVKEAQITLESGAYLSAILMCGSILEGLLLGVAKNNPEKFIRAQNCPKTKNKPEIFDKWTLANLIDVACEVGELKPDLKDFSHAIRNYRNYIHPSLQLESGFNPDAYTAKLCFGVLVTAFADIAGER